jgi:hypothetical protein
VRVNGKSAFARPFVEEEVMINDVHDWRDNGNENTDDDWTMKVNTMAFSLTYNQTNKCNMGHFSTSVFKVLI